MNCNPLPLPTEPFNVAVLQDKLANGMRKNHLDAIDYIAEYYFESSNGGAYYKYSPPTSFNNENPFGEFQFKEKADFRNEVLNKVANNKNVVNYFMTNSKIYEIVSEIYMPRHYSIENSYYINLCQGLLHKNVKPYSEYSKDLKEKVGVFLDFMKEVSCSGDELIFNALIKWYSQVVRGMLTNVILYKKSGEGTGKSTETEFITQYVIGDKVSISPQPECLTGSFNKCLMGKILVIFEELPCFSAGQWAGVSTKLKGFASSPTLQFRDLYEKPIIAKNVFNAIINTNVEAIKNSEQRRIVILPISGCRVKDTVFFSNLRNQCFNYEVGEAFYAYLLSIDVSKFNAQRDFPMTDQKRNAISQMLPTPYKFLKSKLLKSEEIGVIKPKELYAEYTKFCEASNPILKPVLFNIFLEKLAEIQIDSKKTSGNNKEGKKQCGTMFFNISLEHIKTIADKHKWISDYDEYANTEYEMEDADSIEISKKEYDEFLAWKKNQEELKVIVADPEPVVKKLKKPIKKHVVVEPVVEPVLKKEIKKVKKPIDTVKPDIVKPVIVETVPYNLIDELLC